MSIAVRQPIQVHIKWGQVRGRRKIQAALRDAILNALQKAVDTTITKMKEIVPESKKARGRYGPSYDSEALMQTAIDILTQSLTKMEQGRGLKRRYFLKLGFPASYARYMNLNRKTSGTYTKGRGHGWSKEGSETGFYGTSKQLLISEFRAALKAELATAPTTAKEFVGAKQFG